MTNQELKAIEERCEKAFIGYNGPFASSIDDMDEFFTDSLKIIPALLAHIKAQEEEIERLKAKILDQDSVIGGLELELTRYIDNTAF